MHPESLGISHKFIERSFYFVWRKMSSRFMPCFSCNIPKASPTRSSLANYKLVLANHAIREWRQHTGNVLVGRLYRFISVSLNATM